ncbi:aminotransferase class I/II-fold pyridoxal phosphate-dependent enzyme [Scopulibacillus darangshiensis]|nr:aminotransferase class I/II-fold pyridoxal phosphate-dependent enzyme [Scopulibacillus darangshiensis]
MIDKMVKDYMMNQFKTPLLDALTRYKKNQYCSFHVPGHKDGLIFPEKGRHLFKDVLSIDGTEVDGLDDLYQPMGPIQEAQALLAEYYGTIRSYFLVNGSTVGNLTMVLSTCQSGDQVLVQRNSHKSIFNALKLAKVDPIFISPTIDPETHLPVGIDEGALTRALDLYPDAKALILTYPNYYGMASECVNSVIQMAHQKGVLVLVDEAHGAHFKMGGPVPESTIDMGADVIVHSAHKTLPAMTMGSYLHINSETISINKIENVLSMLQSSSPSYPIMASLDLARYHLAAMPKDQMERALFQVDQFAKKLNNIPQIKRIHPSPGKYRLDPFKHLLRAPDGMTGYRLQDILMAAGIYPELADPDHVLLVSGIGDCMDEKNPIDRINKCLNGLQAIKERQRDNCNMPPSVSHLEIAYEDMADLPEKAVPLNEAIGYVLSEDLIPYPPGIPLVLQGEKMTADGVKSVQSWLAAGATFQGSKTVQTEKVKVYDIYEGE